MQRGIPVPLANQGVVLRVPAVIKRGGSWTKLAVKVDAVKVDGDALPSGGPHSGKRRFLGDIVTPMAKRRRPDFSSPMIGVNKLTVPGPLLPLRLLVFDFDQTLSVMHVFKALAGFDGATIPPPYAKTELGQILRIQELDQQEPFSACGGFALTAFGGEERVAELRKMLVDFKERGLELIICTKGLIGTVQKCLEDVDLRSYFSAVYGNIGDLYGETDYDAAAVPTMGAMQLVGNKESTGWPSKDTLIRKLMAVRGFKDTSEACLIEDDPEEIDRARGVCRTLFVTPPRGMHSTHFAELQCMVCSDNEATSEINP